MEFDPIVPLRKVQRWGQMVPGFFGYPRWREDLRAHRTYWVLSLFVSLGFAIWIDAVFRGSAIPPGGDPGNWVATSYIYTGHEYPAQLVPLGYPPLLFPILGTFVSLAGGPAQGVDLFVPFLMVGLGLSTAWLARTILPSTVVALGVVAFVLADPSTLSMFFWGAYPNLLAFVFTNVALVGVLQACRGRASGGARIFWLGFAATVLTHSLAGLVLAGWIAVFLTFSLFLSLPGRRSALQHARTGTLNSVALGAQALLRSDGGIQGALFFLVCVGGYYGGTALLAIPHPSYFVSNPSEFALIPYGTAFEAVVPHLVIPHEIMLEFLAGAMGVALLIFAVVRDRWPSWWEPGSVLLLAWLVAPLVILATGIILQIVTDYHRFGFCLVLPSGLSLAYVLDRAWVSRAAPNPVLAPSPLLRAPGMRLLHARSLTGRRGAGPPSLFPWQLPLRPALIAVVGAIAFLVIMATATVPLMHKDETVYTKVGHDQAFVQAVNAIRHSGVHGGIMTVTGADKWVKALTGENTYAPYGSLLYLFYPPQALDSALTYYALSSHYTMSNGEVTTSFRATDPAYSDGVPDYSASMDGGIRPILSVDPATLQVALENPGNGTEWSEGLYDPPQVLLPPSLEGSMEIVYPGAGFSLTVLVSISPTTPTATVTVAASSTGADTIRGISFAVVPSQGVGAEVTPTNVPGTFDWRLLGTTGDPFTYGSVSPASGLEGITSYDPTTGGPAAVVSFVSPVLTGSSQLGGSLLLSTPSATAVVNGMPTVFTAPETWSDLGVRFILMQNASYAPNPLVAVPDEVPYLTHEYGLPIYFQNNEWTVLEVP